MLLALSGTPGTGKTSLCRELEGMGWVCRDLKEIIVQGGLSEEDPDDGGGILVDPSELRKLLETLRPGIDEDFVLDGHLSYLAPSDICMVLRLRPDELGRRLEARGYGNSKVDENVEAEIVSVVLVEAMELEEERLGGSPWSDLLPGCGTVFEMDATGRTAHQLSGSVSSLVDAWRAKRLNELSDYRPGRVDWLEVVAGWS